jgi:hypothetical protein
VRDFSQMGRLFLLLLQLRFSMKPFLRFCSLSWVWNFVSDEYVSSEDFTLFWCRAERKRVLEIKKVTCGFQLCLVSKFPLSVYTYMIQKRLQKY